VVKIVKKNVSSDDGLLYMHVTRLKKECLRRKMVEIICFCCNNIECLTCPRTLISTRMLSQDNELINLAYLN